MRLSTDVTPGAAHACRSAALATRATPESAGRSTHSLTRGSTTASAAVPRLGWEIVAAAHEQADAGDQRKRSETNPNIPHEKKILRCVPDRR